MHGVPEHWIKNYTNIILSHQNILLTITVIKRKSKTTIDAENHLP